jgi:hypothetical protein
MMNLLGWQRIDLDQHRVDKCRATAPDVSSGASH